MKKFAALLLILAMLVSLTACNIPIVSDFIKSDSSLGKTNNTAVTIAAAMNDYLAAKNKSDMVLYGMEMALNGDGNGAVLLYYTAVLPEAAEYSDIYVAEVDSKTGHVQRFSKANYSDDGIEPYQMVKEGKAIRVDSLPIDSGKAISNGVKAFSGNQDFQYDYIEITVFNTDGLEQYDIRFISMLNDLIYYCTVDGVSGAVLASSTGAL